jgi:hypothetical protein
LIESEFTDALATSARAMPRLQFGSPSPSSEGCAASLRITFDWNRKMAICRECD